MSMNIVDVGTPPDGLKSEGWTTTVVQFHGFANLPTTRGEYVESPEFSCFGHQWGFDIYPGGKNNSSEGYAAVSLCNMSHTSIKLQWGYSVRDSNDKEVVHKKPLTDEFGAVDSERNAWRVKDFAKRSKLMASLVDGSLIVEVRMKSASTSKSITQFIPSNPINKNVLNLYTNAEETADVLFEVGGQQQCTDTNKKNNLKATTVKYMIQARMSRITSVSMCIIFQHADFNLLFQK